MAAMAATPIPSATFKSANKRSNDELLRLTQSSRTLQTALAIRILRIREPERFHGQNPTTSGYFTERRDRRELRLRGMHRITQHANSGDGDLYCVFRDKRAHT